MGAADLGLGSVTARSRNIGRIIRAGISDAPQLWALAVLCGSLVAVEHFHPLDFRASTLRAIIETAITFCALTAACLFALSFAHRRRLRDLLLVAALVEVAAIDLVSYVIPAAMSVRSLGHLGAGPLLGELVMSATFVAAAIVPSAVQLPHPRKSLALALAGGVFGAAVSELGGLLLPMGVLPTGGSVALHGIAARMAHPFGLLALLLGTGLLSLATVRFSREGRGTQTSVAILLATGFVLLMAARLNDLVVPTPDIGWVSARTALRLAGYALVLAAALRQEAAIRRAIAQAAATEERHRIARDLHDGLAQDLAFIAAHGARIAREAGDDHPLAIAASRALAVSRGAIADLSASDAPSARAALRRVADELEVRFGVQVTIYAEDAGLSQLRANT